MINAATITKVLGGRWCGSYGLARCPSHDDRTPSLKISDDANKLDGVDVYCFAGCSWRDVKAEFQRQQLLTEPTLEGGGSPDRPRINTGVAGASRGVVPATVDATKVRIDFALRIWRETVPLQGTPGQRYFIERRGLHIGTLDLDLALRWHQHDHMVVGLMTDPTTGVAIGIHRTFLAKDATKIGRKMLGKQGVLRLSPDDRVTLGLGIVEGLEDGLAVLLSGWQPIWAATSTGAIGRFPILVGIEALTIFADHGKPGMEAARTCAAHWAERGAEAYISSPHRGGGDDVQAL